jgi:UDP-glucuronate 4-epimerase
MTRNILITGAAGFIGFHLASYLALQGDHVIGYDNFNDYYQPKLKRDRAAELSKIGVNVIGGDVCDQVKLKEVVLSHETTHLVHLAAQAGVRYSLSHPHHYIKANVEGFLNILELCRENPSIKLVYASSSSVYGLNTKIPFSADDRTDAQASLYGVTKKTNELMAQTYHHLFGITAIGLRFFTVYGPWGRPDMAYFSFTDAILQGKPIQIFNEGQMLRDFTYIDDIIAGTVGALDRAEGCEIFNLGHHRPNELGTLIDLIEKGIGRKADKIFMPMQAGDVVSTYADIESSTAKLGFMPKVSLSEGISRFIAWHKGYFHWS